MIFANVFYILDNSTFYADFLAQSGWTDILPPETHAQFSKCGFYRYDYQPYTQSDETTLVFIILNTNLYYHAGHAADTDPCGQVHCYL